MSFIRRLSKSQLVRGSLFIFLSSNIVSFGNFLYNLAMGRLLGPKMYGDLGAIFSFLVILGTPLSIISLILVKKTSSYWGKKEKSAIKMFIIYLTPRFFLIGIVMSIIVFLVSPILLTYLSLDTYLPVFIFAAYFILNFPITLNKSILQGTLSFSYLAFNGFIEIILKLFVSIILVIFNFQLAGALLGPLIGGIAAYILTFLELKMILKGVDQSMRKPSLKLLLGPTMPIFLASLSLTMFISVDIILVRYFFSPIQAGEYVALSTIGKIIYYVVGPVISVMFPTISSRKSSGLPYILPLLGTLILSLGLAAIIMFSFFLAPKLIIGILYGSKYYGVIPYLGIFSFFITLYAVNAILTQFLLSISYYRPILLLFPISLLQSIFIFLFHRSITDVIWVNIVISTMYFLVISLCVWYRERSVFRKIFVKLLPKEVYVE